MASQDIARQTPASQGSTTGKNLAPGEFNWLVGYNVLVALTASAALICLLGFPTYAPLIHTLLSVFVAGACGATLCNLRGIFKQMDQNQGEFPHRFKVPFYIRPLTGALTGLVTFFVGHLLVNSLSDASSGGWKTLEGRLPYLGVALLAGFAAQEFMQRLKEVAKTLFAVELEPPSRDRGRDGRGMSLQGSPAYSRGEPRMQNDFTELVALNIQIGDLESAGEAQKLADILATKLAFRRANATIDDRGTVGGKAPDGFLDKVVPGPRVTEVESIHLYGDRAVVTCIVTMPLDPPDKRKKYHNVRLFIREKDGWKLLGWANEEIR